MVTVKVRLSSLLAANPLCAGAAMEIHTRCVAPLRSQRWLIVWWLPRCPELGLRGLIGDGQRAAVFADAVIRTGLTQAF